MAQKCVRETSDRKVEATCPGLNSTFPEDSSAYAVQGTFKASKGRQSADAANLVQILIKIIRLPSVSTDIVITLATPMEINARSAAAAEAGAGPKTLHLSAPALFLRMTDAFIVQNWGLFGQ